ncbi:glycerophosphodiester phosphodiesterase family protein [Microbacterium sp. YY-01]|uniref:glycerophosphodiester phosphodiesterase family protein n=1 Tax=Microbacterium sp. YY-01 TaxID=3421634 RepID=UPI003D185860
MAEPGIIEGFHKAGMTMRAWTVDDPATWVTLINSGVHGIITNLPVEALETRTLVKTTG